MPALNGSQSMTPFALPIHWHSKLADLRRRLLVTLLSVLFYYYPSLLTTVLSLFACFQIDPAKPTSNQVYPQNARVSEQPALFDSRLMNVVSQGENRLVMPYHVA